MAGSEFDLAVQEGVPPRAGRRRYLGFTAGGEPWLMRWSDRELGWILGALPGSVSHLMEGEPTPTAAFWNPDRPIGRGVPEIVRWLRLPEVV